MVIRSNSDNYSNMKKGLNILPLLFLFHFSCTNNKNLYKKQVDLIRNNHFEVFWGVKIDARLRNGNEYIYPDYVMEKENKFFLLPNFIYFKCSPDLKCIEKVTNKKFDVYEYAKKNNIDNEYAVKFAYNKSIELNKIFKKLKVKTIVSDFNIGKCIIFFPNAKEFVAYVPNVDNIKNTFWTEKFTIKNKIYKDWYAGDY
ncbi:hypothetical protein [Halpernia sp. GG3]